MKREMRAKDREQKITDQLVVNLMKAMRLMMSFIAFLFILIILIIY